MTPEFKPLPPELERAVAEIRDETPDTAVVEAAAARVWVKLSTASVASRGTFPASGIGDAAAVIRNCADFQALIPDFRAGRLSEGRMALVRDHLHQCVACRHIYEGKVVAMPAPAAVRRANYGARWALAASVLIVAGATIWWAVNRNGEQTGHAIVQHLDGTLYKVTADGIHPLLAGQDLPSDVELRTAKDSDAVLQLADGSVVEMRERSSLSTSPNSLDLTVRLGRGSVMVKAKHRAKGHLYVDTGDCRVAVTGTLFEVTAGVKGSRVAVIEGEVHVTQDNQEKVLHAGDQTVTNSNVEPESVSAQIAWSRDRQRLVEHLHDTLTQVHPPALRYSSSLLDHLPANTILFISIPNLAQYLADAESVLGQKIAANPQLSAMWNARIGQAVDILRTASDYLGSEIDIVDAQGQDAPVVIAEQKREGFEDFLHKKNLPFTVIKHGGLLLFGPERAAVEAAVGQLDSGFAQNPLYAKIQESYRQGAGLLLWVDLAEGKSPVPGARYFSAESKEMSGRFVGSATLGFDGPRTGLAAQLADPSPMGSLDYISPDALAVLGFVVKDPGAIIDEALAIPQGSIAAAQEALAEERQQKGFDIREDLAASLGGEFAVAMDGSLMPVPSWKLVSEIYNPDRFQATLQRFIDAHNQEIAKSGKQPIRMTQETVDGRVYYSIAQVNGGPLLEAHYTFDQGYLVAAPTRALVTHALQIRLAGTSIKHSGKFLDLTPRDRHLNFSGLIYQNLGSSLAPFAALAGAFMPQHAGANGPQMPSLDNIKPTLFAVYGEPDRVTLEATGDVLGSTLQNLMSGDIRGLAGLPFAQMTGTRQRQHSYSGK
jgi:ferric-dicitrate binding protein FerR (iron transport regulator)